MSSPLRTAILLRPSHCAARAEVEPLALPPAFSSLPQHHATVMAGEAHVTFLSEIRAQPELLNEDIAALANNSKDVGKSALLAALDVAAECRVPFDRTA